MRFDKGLSLVEICTLIIVLGFLALLAVPNYNLLAQKSKSSEAKLNLSVFYAAQKSFHGEWRHYDGGFLQVGFKPEGLLNYEFASSSLYKDTEERLNYIVESPNLHNQVRYLRASDYCDSYSYASCEMNLKTAVDATKCYPDSPSNDVFVACASANFGKGVNDEWSINHNKQLMHLSAGE